MQNSVRSLVALQCGDSKSGIFGLLNVSVGFLISLWVRLTTPVCETHAESSDKMICTNKLYTAIRMA